MVGGHMSHGRRTHGRIYVSRSEYGKKQVKVIWSHVNTLFGTTLL